MSDELKAIYDRTPINSYFYLPTNLADEAQRTLIPERKVTCRRWPDGRVMYKRVK